MFTSGQVDKFTSKQVACETYNSFTCLQVDKFTSSQVAYETYNLFTRSLVHSFTFFKTHLLLVYYFSIFTAEDY